MLTLNRMFLVGSALTLALGITHCGDDTSNNPADMKMTTTADMAVPPDMTTLAAPVISMISPATASNAGGATLTITGTGFQTGATVTVGGTACGNPNVTATQITCTIPAKAANCAVAAIVVTNPDSKSVTAANNFSYKSATLDFGTAALTPAPATGMNPRRIISADVDNDGKMDIVSVNQNTAGTVSIMTGKGDGTFNTKNDISVGASPADLVLADVTGDGKLDIVTANAAGVSFLAGNGAGTFAAAVTVGITALNTVAIAAADLNNDNKVDLVVATSGSTALVFMNSGTGNFFGTTANVTLATAGAATDVEIAALEAGGKPDVLVSNGTSFVSVFKNTTAAGAATATFATKVDYTTGMTPKGLRVVDVTGDGKLDIVTANSGGNSVSVLAGNATATAPFFGTKADYGTANLPESVFVSDLNNDGVLDIVTANATTNNWSRLIGQSNGGYVATVNLAAGTNATGITVTDLNGDKQGDVVVGNMGAATLSVFTQKCN